MPHNDKPTSKQNRYLRQLAERTGTSFTPPSTNAQASREIEWLKGLERSPRHDRDADRREVWDAPQGGAHRVRDEEITGWGSTASWGIGRVTRGYGDRG